ncbi:uncharacterized protein P7C73_g2060, partial [Tremellales sp. Uapishka_1]
MPFTPVETLLGGLLLHLSTSTLLGDTGRVLGISGIVDGVLLGKRETWQLATVAGLLLGPLASSSIGVSNYFPDDGSNAWASQSVSRLMLAGGLVGLGSRLGSGCTSGHFLCGASRLSPRSICATITFFSTAVLTAALCPASIASASPAYALAWPTPMALSGLIATCLVLASAHLISRATLSSPRFRLAPYFLSGLTFSIGLSMSGMVSPLKVISFLRLLPLLPPWTAFDPSLAMVVLGGVVPNAIHYAYISGTPKPRLAWEKWQVPSRRDIDWRLVTGAAIFGIGWGLSGVCPGPAIVSLGQVAVAGLQGENVEKTLKGVVAFGAAMIVGMGSSKVL